MKKVIDVVGAIIENDQNEILCALRSTTMSLPNLWEFPGGKIDSGEDEATALRREIREELGCKIDVVGRFDEVIHEYPSVIIKLITHKCQLISGTPTASEHAKLIWLRRENLASIVWAPADVPTVDKIVRENYSPVSSS